MSKQRVVNTRFWVDPWVQSELNSLDRFLFIYLLTNDQTNISGIYEISLHKICFETGIEKETLVRAMLPRLEPKVYMEGNWVILVNFPKHQNLSSEPVMKGIHRELASIPDSVYEKAIGYGYPIHRVSGTKPNLTKPTVTANAGIVEEVQDLGDSPSKEYSRDSKSPRIPPDKQKAYDELIAWSEHEREFKFPKTTILKQYRAFKLANQNGFTRQQLMDKWEEMSTDKFWQKAGWDWMNVVQQLTIKPV